MVISFTLFPSRQVVDDVVDGVRHVVVARDVHVDELQEGRALDPEPLGSFAAGVQTSGEDMEPESIQVSGKFVTNPGVTTGNLKKED